MTQYVPRALCNQLRCQNRAYRVFVGSLAMEKGKNVVGFDFMRQKNRLQTIALSFILACVRRLNRLNFSNGSVEILFCLLFGLCQIAVHPSNNAKETVTTGKGKQHAVFCGDCICIRRCIKLAVENRLEWIYHRYKAAGKIMLRVFDGRNNRDATATMNESPHQNTIIT